MGRFTISPRAYRRVTFGALLALAFIVVTGAGVRLTGSGLGCPDWPTCDGGTLVATSEYHGAIESLNRTITGLVSVAVMLAVLGSLARQPRRKDLTWLSWGLVGGVLAQIVLGGLVVLFHLYPPLVMGHFVVSMVLLLNAAVLHHRAGRPDDLPRPTGDRTVGRILVGTAAAVLFLGTVVTGSGPHAGSHDGELVDRLPFEAADAARIHSVAVYLLLGLTLAIAVVTVRSGGSRVVLRRTSVLLALLVAQGALGYAQYFNGVPALLVGIHVAGAVAIWIAAIQVHFALSEADETAPVPADSVPVA